MKTSTIRSTFLEYFENQNHQVVSSSSLVPLNDPSLFFTNSGMVQFKEVFLGKKSFSHQRAASVQRCLRASGKHNDLENVGYTNRHHTFFEMLGNFSFGDYFKKEAIHYAWDFLTNILKIDPKKLWITVHQDDEESETIWYREFVVSGKSPQGFSQCSDRDNFWSMGDTGPCGYCTEIFYDHGPRLAGSPPGVNQEGERYVEIWNLVFMQFVREAGKLATLPRPSVDTGMGLERIAAVMQGVTDNYEIDTFRVLRENFSVLMGEHRQVKSMSQNSDVTARVVTDHIRSTVFLIADGVLPSNEKTGYVLRSILRRAVYYLYRLGIRDPFLYQLVPCLIQLFGDVYPGVLLNEFQGQIISIIKQEEVKFLETLDRGLKILETSLKNLKNNTISGFLAFNLHDTYGLPIALTEEIARERNLSLNRSEFEEWMEKQRASSKVVLQPGQLSDHKLEIDIRTNFTGYDETTTETKVIAIFDFLTGSSLTEVNLDGRAIIVLADTPFYAESGGQIGDSGTISSDCGIFLVEDTQKQNNTYLHYGKLIQGNIIIKSAVTAVIDVEKRSKITSNHSATHLLHKSLRLIIGEHGTQRGSYVDDRKLRFDFSRQNPLTKENLLAIERMVNRQIRKNLSVITELKLLEEARIESAYALFSDKYEDRVRVVNMNNFSKELCGGTHVKSTGEIGLFKIISELGVAAGIRRIEAVTGENALELVEQFEDQLNSIGQILKSPVDKISSKLTRFLEENNQLCAETKRLRNIFNINKCNELIKCAVVLNDVHVIVTVVEDIGISPREIVRELRQRLASSIVILIIPNKNKLLIVTSVTDNLTLRLEANTLLSDLIELLGGIGDGGGSKEIAQGSVTIENLSVQKVLDLAMNLLKNGLEKSLLI